MNEQDVIVHALNELARKMLVMEAELKTLQSFTTLAHVDLTAKRGLAYLMFMHDNIYANFTPEDRKFQSLQHAIANAKAGTPSRHVWADKRVDDLNTEEMRVHRYLEKLQDKGVSLCILDVGAHVAAFGIDLAGFLRDRKNQPALIIFEPGYTLPLVQQNVWLNGLKADVRGQAVGTEDGMELFAIKPGHTDSGHVLSAGDRFSVVSREGFTLRPVQIVSMDTVCAGLPHADHYLFKIDTEGLEKILVNELMKQKVFAKSTVILEYTPRHFASQDDRRAFFEGLLPTHALFDIGVSMGPHHITALSKESLATFGANDFPDQYGFHDVMAIPHAFVDAWN